MTTAARLPNYASPLSAELVSKPKLQCPQCSDSLEPVTSVRAGQDRPLHHCGSYRCPSCLFLLSSVNGIWKALAPHRADYFERFTRDYQAVRAAEGRGSESPAYYLALPDCDPDDRNASQWAIRSRTFNYIERKLLPPIELARPVGLKILDLGAGNGWLSYRLALRGHQPVAVDLLTNDQDGLGAAAHFQPALAVLFPRFQAELDRLPFGGSQFDLAVFNASFHYSENYERTLKEAIRCVRPGGTVLIADTAWYRRAESGERMLSERRQAFIAQYGFASDGINSLEYLTNERLANLEKRFGIRWKVYSPFYGFRWAMRPVLARLRSQREPSRFRIYVAKVQK
jgi:SAM-dependent methyltransferase